MKTRIYILLILSLFAGFSVLANEVDIITAKNVAKNAFFEKAASYLSLAYKDIVVEEETVIYNNDVPLIYIFNVNTDKGFIIISAQDNVYPVLGFSYEGAYVSESYDIPSAFTDWIENYKEQIIYAVDNSLESSSEIYSDWTHFSEKEFAPDFPKGVVEPLIATEWGQGNPYHAFTPQHPDADVGYKGERHCPTGCVATAMAQVLRYWSYPSGYNWSTMATSYNEVINPGDPDPPGCLDVATLMNNVGTSVFMDYGPDGSGALSQDVPNALMNTFTYHVTAEYVSKNSYNAVDWENKLITELTENRPLIYRGQKITGVGHAWVCDGCIGNYFHFNWGKGGTNNGNFILTNCYYIFFQGAVIGIQPPPSPSPIIVIAPNETVGILQNTNYQIKWESTFPETEKVKIDLIKYDNLNVQIASYPIAGNADNNKIYVWNVTQDIYDRYKIRITRISQPLDVDESDEYFSIEGTNNFIFISPQGNNWTKGGTYPIEWQCNFPDMIKLELVYDDGNPANTITYPIIDNLINVGSYKWTIAASGGPYAGDHYYVKETRKLDNTTTLSDEFKIITPEIKVTFPDGGNNFSRNTTHSIKWTANFADSVKIEIEGGTPSTLKSIDNETTNDGLLWWTIDPATTPGNNYKIVISRTSDNTVFDKSDNTFSIGNIEITNPWGGEKWGRGSTHDITWKSALPASDLVNLEIYSPIAGVTINFNGLPNSGSYTWNIDINQLPANDYKVKITSGTNVDESMPFSIVEMEVISPNGGQVWAKGTQHDITWSSNGTGQVIIELLKVSGGTSVWSIANPTSNDGTYHNWTVPGALASGNYILKISRTGYPGIYDESDNPFTVGVLEVKTPNGNEKLQKGSNYNIEWVGNPIGNITITLKKSTTVKPVANNISGTNSYIWTVPIGLVTGDDYKIKIESDNPDEAAFWDMSDQYFSIFSPLIADFSAAPLNPFIGTIVYFTDLSINTPTSWSWDFGDGGTSVLQNPTHAYATAGTYTVTLTATNAYGSDTKIKTDYINVLPTPTLLNWTGNVSNDFLNPANWSPVYDPTGLDLIIGPVKAFPPIVLDGEIAIVGALTIMPMATLTIASEGSLTTNGIFTNNGTFVIETDGLNGYSGSYLDNGLPGGIAGLGTFEFNREMLCTGTTGGALDPNWHYLAAPLDGFSTHSMFDYYVNAWSEAASSWIHIEGMAPNCIPGPNVPLNPLAAWSINYANDYACGVINPGTGLTLEFAGGAADMHTGPFAAPATFTPGAYQGWNMFANPYPSGLDMNLIGFDPNMVPGAAYWDGCAGNYVYWTPALGAYSMAPGLGFFTEWTGPGLFSVTGAERAHGADWFWKADVSDLVTLQISGNEKSDITHIRFMDNAQVGFAKDGDFHKLFVDGAPMIYTTAGADQLAVNALPETESVPMGFTATNSGDYTLEATETSDFSQVYLEDKVTGAVTDLLTDSYSFNYQDGDNPDRFVIHFKDVPVSSGEEPGISVFSAQNNVIVGNTSNLEGKIAIYNVVGQCIKAVELENGTNTIALEPTKGIYIVKVHTSSGVVNKKVYIQ